MARPEAIIDWLKVGKLLEAGCDGEGCAAFLGVHPNTLYRACKRDNKISFSDFSQQKRSKGNAQLHVKQYDAAMSGNITMLIWLGKNRLGQADKTEVSGPDSGPIAVALVDYRAHITDGDA